MQKLPVWLQKNPDYCRIKPIATSVEAKKSFADPESTVGRVAAVGVALRHPPRDPTHTCAARAMLAGVCKVATCT